MVKGLHSYNALLVSQSTFTTQVSIRPFAQTFTQYLLEASLQSAKLFIRKHIHTLMKNHQQQLEVQYLAQGHFDMQTGAVGIKTPTF